MKQNVRVLIADDSPNSRKGLHALLGTFPGIELVQDARDGVEAVNLAQEIQPDVMLVDIKMPRLDGIQAIRQIKKEYPQIRLIALTIYINYQREAMEAGADFYLLKGCSAQDLYQAIIGPLVKPRMIGWAL
ncbi:MAG: response regulator transcription factor [Anaerolineaceae bacterium]